MFRSTQFRFVVIALFAVAAVSLTAVSARALSQESNGAGEIRAIRRLLIQTSRSTFSASAWAHNNSNRVVRGSSVSNGAN